MSYLSRVRDQLSRYEHPLLCFEAQESGDVVQVSIALREMRPGIHTYRFDLHPRDLESPQFAWQFQRQLYDCLHDYIIEMFIHTPQDLRRHDTD